ncbi:Chaoptin [Brachionus plicatilis]|uniref:Chaoptin n=1 Tax=Brachionus plicatilis TaxID=10195 RepID=A0A3M7SI44_BRAPC|nr:Chaoptin [Brachionus plicatilis]
MTKILVFIILTNFILTEQQCPFPSCKSSVKNNSCEVICDGKTVPNISDPTQEISYLKFSNLEHISSKAFQHLKIKQLIINSTKLESVDSDAFVQVYKLDSLDLLNVFNLSFFFPSALKNLENLTNTLRIDHSNITSEDLEEILENIESWSRLSHLSLTNNHISNLDYNFENFTYLKTLYLHNNQLEKFNLTSSSLEYLGLDRNKISVLNGKELSNLPNLSHLDLNGNYIEQFECEENTNLKILSLTGNRITTLGNHTFKNLTNLQKLYLNENNVTNMSMDTFCHLNRLSVLSLSSNPIGYLNLSCLGSLEQLVLSNTSLFGQLAQNQMPDALNLTHLDLSLNQIEGIDFGDFSKLNILYLNGNNLSNISNKSTQAIFSVKYLDLSHNNFTNLDSINLQNLKNLNILSISSNFLSKIDHNHLIDNQELMELDLSLNQVDKIEFPQLDELFYIDLSGNKIQHIQKSNFCELKNLEYLYLSDNQISSMEPKSFSENRYLQVLYLDNNKLKMIPDIHKLAYLAYFELSNNEIVSLPNNAFEKTIHSKSPTRIDLRNNNITKFSSKAFCSRFSQTFGLENTVLYFDNLNSIDKCLLTQIRSNSVLHLNETNCGMNYFATLVNVTVFGKNYNQTCHTTKLDECQTNFYTCPRREDFVRFTTWITGDPHVFSYKKGYQVCDLKEQKICFEYGNFTLLCHDQLVQNSTNATILTNVEFIYTFYDGGNVSVKFDNESFPAYFSNNQKVIIDEVDGYKETVAEIFDQKNMKILVLYESKTHIFISKNERYFSVILRATHDTYAESTGVLFDGCQVSQTKMKKRKKRDTDCDTVCSEADFSTGDENMSKDDLEQACNFDCSVIVIAFLVS